MEDLTCSVDGCDKPRKTRGWCPMHYERWRTGRPFHGPPKRLHGKFPCRVDGCVRDASSGQDMLCQMHRTRLRRTGEVGGPMPQRFGYEGFDGDRTTWLSSDGYVNFHRDGKSVRVHRAVMEEVLGRPLAKHENVHHLNGIKSDNRPENLELWVKPPTCGQRPSDLVEWVVTEYPELVEAALNERNQLRLAV